MDYLDIIVNGYVNEYEHFNKYLLREQKKAEANHYDAEEFFSKCIAVIERFKEDIEGQYNKRKGDIYLMRTLNPPLSDEEFISSMDDNKRTNYSINLYWATKYRYTGHLFYGHVLNIEYKIKECQEKVLINIPKENDLTPEIENKDIEKIWFKVGLLFATGEMEKYYNTSHNGMNESYSAPKIAKEFNLPEGVKYILGTFNEYANDKNIFANKNKITKIKEYCQKNNIKVIDSFST
ncbi:hypothetical protein [Gillisia sp. CAL575]|uniref:hypothetical protein n=1 Tax=Gillisia sp. CAL575 TaxID=985255 RepID=UPI0003A7C45C|nr:hypothetical protein [Gillisia sp. CAL575]